MFDHTSRYYDLETAILRLDDGREVAYKRRRFLPQGRAMTLLATAVVGQDDRLDLVSARTLGDPLAWWRIADANDAMDPSELVAVPGRALRIPLP